VARPPSRLYRFQKLVSPEQGGFFAAGIAVAGCVDHGSGRITWLFIQEKGSAREQARLREQAELAERTELIATAGRSSR